MRVAIIGAGWFGCHIGKSLLKKGIDVTIFEKNADIFSGASQYNTGRLHLGFHYPRSEKTRKQSKEGFVLFNQEYSHCCEPVNNNLYLVVNNDSLLDFKTYCSILDSENLSYQIIDPIDYGFKNMEGGMLCEEKAINHVKASEYFRKELNGHLLLNTTITQIKTTDGGVLVNNQFFDFCINCTYYTFNPGKLSQNICYENIITTLFKPTEKFIDKSFVIMDGDFFSVNPYYLTTGEMVYSLYHVKHSVLDASLNYSEATNYFNSVKKQPIQQQLSWKKMMDDVSKYYPDFLEELEPQRSFLSLRTRLVNGNANRECIVESNDTTINVLSGKINSIFEAEDRVNTILENI